MISIGQIVFGLYELQETRVLSRTQAGPGRTVKQQQEEISPNHVLQRLNLISVDKIDMLVTAHVAKKLCEKSKMPFTFKLN